MKLPTLSYLTDVYLEAGAVGLVADLVRQRGMTRPLVVTDRGLVELGVVDRLRLADAVVFAEVPPNPTEASVLAGLRVYADAGCDGLVALGGGSPIDCAKGIALLATHPQPLEQYAFIKNGAARITADKPPVIAVPTTAGTGSEVGRGAVITFGPGRKLAIISKHMIPTAAVCDPELTLGLPAGLTAATGMDAISHCVETFCSPKFNPVADAIALDGLARALGAIRSAVQNGSQLADRQEMMIAALEGGLTFQKGLGMVHSLSHALGSLSDRPLHHGTLNAVLLPHVLRFNTEAIPGKTEQMARIAGLASAAALPNFFELLAQELGLPTNLGALGVTPADARQLAPAAAEDHCCWTNPRPISAADCQAVLAAAID